MPVINGVYLKDFAALPGSVDDANIIPIAISGNQVAYRTTVAGIITDARITSKLLTGLIVTGGSVVATDTILEAFGKVQNQINNRVNSGGSSVNYYLNGSVPASVGTYYQMDNTPVIGTGTDFTLTGNGLIAQFLTDANNPNRLLIPAGAWNFEMYFQVSSAGGSAKFYVELLKYNGSIFTSIASSSAVPEEITNGTTIDLYVTSIAVPETALLITDRLAIRVYIVDNSGGRTVTLHTEDNTLCQIVTTFAGGISALNGLTANTQYFAVGSTGTDFNIVSTTDTHTFNIPSASAINRGLITTGTQTIAGSKTFNSRIVVSTADPIFLQSNLAASTNPTGMEISNTSGATRFGTEGITGGSFFTGATPYATVIGSSNNYPFDLYSNQLKRISIAASGEVTIFNQLQLNSTITNGTYTYTLPSATGTLALTSALSGYLPLSGGTLTGALTGTSATFSSKVAWGTGTYTSGVSSLYNTVDDGTIFVGKTGSSTDFNFTNGAGATVFSNPTGTTTLVLAGALSGTSATYTGNGAFGTTSGNLEVGYGTTQGVYKLDVNGTVRASGAVTFSNLAGTGTRMVQASSTGALSASNTLSADLDLSTYTIKSGAVFTGITDVGGNFTVSSTMYTVRVSTAGGASTATLPDAATNTGRILIIGKYAGGSNVTIQCAGSDTFAGGATSKTITTIGEFYTLQSNGQWVILNQYIP